MRRLLTAALLLAPLAALAAPCKFQAPRNLQADLAGIKAVQIELHSQNLHLTGSGSAGGLTLNGRACASDSATLEHLTVTQQRVGDQLLIDIGNDNHFSFHLFGDSYAYLDITAQLPANVPVTLSVGSGDFKADGIRGDAKVGSVGSGDVVLRKVGGSVHADTLGSGDFTASDVAGDFTLSAKGSGDVNHSGVKGKVSVPKSDDD